jgi:hypothetical protein
MVTRPQLSAFSKSLMRSYNSSRGGTRAAEKVNIVQTANLKPFTAEQRTGQPLKAAAWRE